MNKKYPGERLLEHNREFIKRSREMSNEFTIEDRNNISDHDLLIRVDERTGRIDKWCFNHDSKHFRYNLLAWSVTLGAIITLGIMLIKVL